MAAKKKPAKLAPGEIDPMSAAIVLAYVEGAATPEFVAAADLHGGDLAKLAYQRALQDAIANRQVLVAPGETLPEPTRPERATPAELAALAAELVATGAFTYASPPTEPTTPAPAGTEAQANV